MIKFPAVTRLKATPLMAGATINLTFLLISLILNFLATQNNKVKMTPKKIKQ
jgi:hypothetical protein